MNQRPNFFIILDLDTSISDWSTIEKVIQDKRRAWAMQKNQGSPSARRKSERWLKLIPEMETLFKDPTSRKAEAKAADKEQKQDYNNQLELLEQQIKMLNSTTVFKDDIKLLRRNTGNIFSELEIEEKLKEQGITLVVESNKPNTETRPKWEPSDYKSIQNKLKTLNLNSLYDFLNLDYSPKLSIRSSTRALYDRADSIYKDISRSGKIDPDSSLKKDLTGNCKAAFKGTQEKERYDNSLADEQLTSLDKLIEIAGRDRFLDTKDIENLIGIAKKQGISEIDAMFYIDDYAKKKNWGIQKEQQTTSKPLLCAFCNTLAESSQDKHCIKCGEALIQPCPQCGKETPTEYTACGQCGYHTGDAPLVNALFKDGKQYLFDNNFEQAIVFFDRALHYWGDWQPAIDAKNQATTQQQAKLKNIRQTKELIKERKLEAAQVKLESLPKEHVATENQLLTKIINKGLQDAKQAFDNAELLRRNGRSEEAFKSYEESLSYCVDFSLALSAIASTPPPAPIALNADWVGESLRLKWEQVKANGEITYYLIRKQKGFPTNKRDGELIAETSGVSVDDVTITPGISFFYALFSSRAKVFSSNFATSGPYFKLADVEQLEYRVGHQQVSIEWQAPDNHHSVEVWRYENKQPERNKLGEKIFVSGDSLVDSDLKNDQRYGYLIVVKFKDPTGQTDFFYSKGLSFFATPTAPPKPILDLTVERQGRTASLKWTPIPSKNTHVQIRKTQLLTEMAVGQLISTSKVNLFGSLVPINTDGQTQVALDTQGCIFFTPLTVVKETVVVGKTVRITTLDDVSNIVSQNTGRNISLSWNWPSGASEVLIAYQYDRFPLTVNEKESTLTKITRTEYDRKQCWELRSAARKKHYFKIFVHDAIANINSDGVQFLEAMGQERTVQYKVVTKKKLFAKKPHQAWIELSSQDSSSLHNLQVVMKVNYPPVSLKDGMLIIEMEHLSFTEGMARIDIPIAQIKKGYIKIFFANHQNAREVRLLPSAKEQLKII